MGIGQASSDISIPSLPGLLLAFSSHSDLSRRATMTSARPSLTDSLILLHLSRWAWTCTTTIWLDVRGTNAYAACFLTVYWLLSSVYFHFKIKIQYEYQGRHRLEIIWLIAYRYWFLDISVSGLASDDNEWDILKWYVLRRLIFFYRVTSIPVFCRLPLSFKLTPGTRSGDSRFGSKA